MKRVVPIVALATLVAGPLAAQHMHPGTPQPTPPPAGAPARPMMSGGMGGMMMPGMDSMKASHGMPMMMMQMAGMDSTMTSLHALRGYAPRALLERRAALRLDDDQVNRLAGIAAINRPVHDSAMAAAQHHRRALHEALASGGDHAAAATHFDALHAAMGAAHAAELRGALEARAVLTAGQRSLVDGAPAHNHGGGS